MIPGGNLRKVCVALIALSFVALWLTPAGVHAQTPTPTPTPTGPELPTVFAGSDSAFEGDAGTTQVLQIELFLSFLPCETVTVDFTTSSPASPATGEAVPGEDFLATSGTAVFAPGQDETTVSVTILGDSTAEPDESFDLLLSNPQGATLDEFANGIGFILDDDTPPELSIFGFSVSEGDSGTRDLNFEIDLSHPFSQPVTVNFATQDGTATVADNDYEPVNTTVTIPAGQTFVLVPVPVNGDTQIEPTEFLTGVLSSPQNATLSSFASDTGTIFDDDQIRISIFGADNFKFEGDTGTTPFTFNVSLNRAAASTVTVEVRTQDGSATVADNDYQPIPPSPATVVTFAPGETLQTVTVLVNGDTTVEPNESFGIVLVNPTGAVLSDSSDTGFIRNDDGPPFVNLQGRFIDEGNTTPLFAIFLDFPVNQPVTVQFSTSDETATAGSDYTPASNITVTIPAGETSAEIPVTVIDDTIAEDFETLLGTISSPVNATLGGSPTSTAFIGDNDQPPPPPCGPGSFGGGEETPPSPSPSPSQPPPPPPPPPPPASPEPQPSPTPTPVEGCDPATQQCGTSEDDTVSTSNGTVITGPGQDFVEIITDPGTSNVFVDAGPGKDEVTLDINAGSGDTQTIEVQGGCGQDTISLDTSGIQPGADVDLMLLGQCDGDNIELPAALPVGVNAQIGGGEGPDEITSAPLIGLTGNSIVSRRAARGGIPAPGGFDIDAGNGDDLIMAGASGDVVLGGGGSDSVEGAAGDDELSSGEGLDNQLSGGAGNDAIRSKGINDRLIGGEGEDTIRSKGVESRSVGGDGDDTIRSKGINDHLIGGDGNDTIRSKGISGRVEAGRGDDFVEASTGDDIVFGGAGRDTIALLAGNDQGFAGAGNDIVDGGPGDDIVDGGQGNDTCFAGTGRDELRACEE